MKTKSLFAVVAIALLCGFTSPQDYIRQVANSYFRMGAQAAIIAIQRQQQVERELLRKYPDGDFGTNAADFKLWKGSVLHVDDPRIFAVVQEVNGGMFGIDTNNWSKTNSWMLLKP